MLLSATANLATRSTTRWPTSRSPSQHDSQLDSGSGRAPPMLHNLESGEDIINVSKDGTPELVAKPFTVRKREDGGFELQVTTRSLEDAAPYIPHIAAQIGCPKEQVLQFSNQPPAQSSSGESTPCTTASRSGDRWRFDPPPSQALCCGPPLSEMKKVSVGDIR